jgi:hypothetical protein
LGNRHEQIERKVREMVSHYVLLGPHVAVVAPDTWRDIEKDLQAALGVLAVRGSTRIEISAKDLRGREWEIPVVMREDAPQGRVALLARGRGFRMGAWELIA